METKDYLLAQKITTKDYLLLRYDIEMVEIRLETLYRNVSSTLEDGKRKQKIIELLSPLFENLLDIMAQIDAIDIMNGINK